MPFGEIFISLSLKSKPKLCFTFPGLSLAGQKGDKGGAQRCSAQNSMSGPDPALPICFAWDVRECLEKQEYPGDVGMPRMCWDRRKSAKGREKRELPGCPPASGIWCHLVVASRKGTESRGSQESAFPSPLEVEFVAERGLGDSCSPQERHPMSCTESEMSLTEQPHKTKFSALPNTG